MWSDDAFEDELRLRFSMLDVPEPSTLALTQATRTLRRWRQRRRLLFAAPGVAAAAVLAGVVSLGGVGGTGDIIRLANYTFPLPSGFHLTGAASGPCRAAVAFTERFSVPPGSPPRAAETILTGSGKTGAYSTAKIASAAGADGGCVLMALTDPFTPTSETGNPSYALTASPSAHRVDIAGRIGWLTSALKMGESPVLQLTVELPQAGGQMRDLGVGASGLSASELLTIVAAGLP